MNTGIGNFNRHLIFGGDIQPISGWFGLDRLEHASSGRTGLLIGIWIVLAGLFVAPAAWAVLPMIASGGGHTCSLTSAGAVQCWGDNSAGQIGNGATQPSTTPVAVGGLSGGVVAIAAGGSHSCALTGARAAQCWGYNIFGELGTGTTKNSATPVAVTGLSSGVAAIAAGNLHTCALTSAGAVQCWGWNESGQLGDGTNTSSNTPVAVSGLSRGVVAIAAGGVHSCALTSTGEVWCWGGNDYGQLGDGTTMSSATPVAVSGLSGRVVAIAAGGSHTCALSGAGGVQCWGANEYGQLGNGTTTASATPVAVSGLTGGVAVIGAGSLYTCALTSAGAVQCWGRNNDGQLGNGTNTDSTTPFAVSGLAKGVVAISTGASHSCALIGTGMVQCWGSDTYGELGDGTTTRSSTPVTITGLRLFSIPQTISFVMPPRQTSGAEHFTLGATASSGLPVSFRSTTQSVCTVSGNTVTAVATGTCGIAADQAGDATFDVAPEVIQSFTVLIPQTIGFVAIPNKTLGTAPFTVSATASSGLPVSFASTTLTVCTVSGNTVTLVAAGACAIAADQAGNATYAAAPRAAQAFMVLTAQTISFAAPTTKTLDSAPFNVSASASSGLPVSFSSTTPTVCTVSGNTVTLVAAGTCAIAADQAGIATHAAAPRVTQAFTVLATQAISFATPANQPIGTAPFAVSATASSGLPVSFSSITPAVCTVSGNTVTLVAAGTCAIAADQTGNATYAAARWVAKAFKVLATQTIRFDALPKQTLGAVPFTLGATASSGLPVSFSSITPAVCTVSGNAVTLVAAGTCAIAAHQAGDAIYAAAPQVSQSIAVLATQTIRFAALPNITLSSVPFIVNATASSGLPVGFSSTTPTVCTVSGNTVTLVAAGACAIAADQAGDATYTTAPRVVQSFTVLATQTISFAMLSNKPAGSAPFTVSATASSGLPVGFSSITPAVCTVGGNTVTLVEAGTCAIAAEQAGNADYAAAPRVAQAFMVLTPQTISFARPANRTLGSAPFTVIASASSGLPVSFSSTTPKVCTNSGNIVTLAAAGSCAIAAEQAGNATYAAAMQASQTFTVMNAQTISFGPLLNEVVTNPPFTVSATASSGLPVSFSSITTNVCTVSGNTVTMVSTGTCTLAADQAGDTTYSAAPQVTQSFQVLAAHADGKADVLRLKISTGKT